MLKRLTAYKAWANRELFDVLHALPTDTNAESRHMMIRLLNHVYVVDRIFRGHLSGQAHGYSALNTPDTPTLDTLWHAVQETDQWYIDYAAGLQAAQLDERLDFQFVDGKAGNLSRAEMLLHVINHGSYHRGGVGELLKQCAVTPPKDVLTRFL